MKKTPPSDVPPGTLNIYEAKTRLSELVDRAARGEEIVISKRGKPVARLCAMPSIERKFGVLKGKLSVPDDFDKPLPPDIQRYFDGEDDGDK
jgi:prevent-host-death family protein